MAKNNLKHIGILGGSFDPPHKGHLFISRKSLKLFKLEKIIWAITKKNPFKKKPLFTLNKRKKMCLKMIQGNRKICLRHYEHKLQSKTSFSLVNYLKKINKCRIFFIMGADNLINFHKWHNYKELLKISKIIVFSRKGYNTKAKKSVIMRSLNKKNIIFINNLKINISSTHLRNQIINGS